MLSREWRCSWRSADKRCSNCIWVIDNLIAKWGGSYIRGLTVVMAGTATTSCKMNITRYPSIRLSFPICPPILSVVLPQISYFQMCFRTKKLKIVRYFGPCCEIDFSSCEQQCWVACTAHFYDKFANQMYKGSKYFNPTSIVREYIKRPQFDHGYTWKCQRRQLIMMTEKCDKSFHVSLVLADLGWRYQTNFLRSVIFPGFSSYGNTG